MEKRKIKIFMVSGKARHGKTTIANIIEEYYKQNMLKVARCSIAIYIKFYAQHYFGWDGREETKPRELLQKLGTDFIRTNIRDTFFIERTIDDIEVLSYFFDVIVIDDTRFVNEITMIKERFDNVTTIHVERINFETELTSVQQHHSTETGLDNYHNYDYQVINDTLDKLTEDTIDILEGKYEQ